MRRNVQGVIARLTLLLLVSLPALADTEFQIKRMTRDDIPFGKGQCDIRLRVDGEVEVSVRGDRVYIRTVSGRDGRDVGSECNEPLPNRNIESLKFEVRDRRGDIRLLSGPSRRNGFRAVVRIRDSKSGEGRYHFRLSWAMDGGGSRSGKEPDFERGKWWRGSGASLGSAVDACGEAVSGRIARDYRSKDVEILNARADTPVGRDDYMVIGEAIARQRGSTAIFSYTCRVDSSSGRVRTADVQRR